MARHRIKPNQTLTLQERELLQYLWAGCKPKHIASYWKVEPRRLSYLRHRIYDKTGGSTVIETINLIRGQGILLDEAFYGS